MSSLVIRTSHNCATSAIIRIVVDFCYYFATLTTTIIEMPYPIKFLSLQKAELEYEVAVRGDTTENESVQDLRKPLPSEDILESHLEPNEDLTQIKETQNKIKLN